MAKKQDVKIDDLVTIKPITDNQKVVRHWKKIIKNYSFMESWYWKDFYFFVSRT